MSQLIAMLHQLISRHDDEGATAVEYGLMVALIAGAIVLTVTTLGTNLGTLFGSVGTTIASTAANF